MRTRHGTFVEIFQARSPIDTDSFRILRDEVRASGTPRLREFFVALNRELAARLAAPGSTDLAWAADLCVALMHAAPEATAAALGALLDEAELQVHEPLVAVVFEAVDGAPALLDVMSRFVETERQLLQFRVRALEALVTKSPGGGDAGAVGLEAQPALRFLNAVFEELGRGPGAVFGESCARWAAGFGSLRSLFREREEPQVLEWLADALGRLASAPGAPETVRVVLRVLRANIPVPAWHPAAPRPTGESWRGDVVAALIVDKALQVVLAVAVARWRRGSVADGPASATELWPFHERVLESALIDAAQSPRARAAAAGLLRLLKRTNASAQVTERAELYADLLLAPYERHGGSGVDAGTASEDRLDLLVDALHDPCGLIRRAAVAGCRDIARAKPAWFQPRHYTKLLPLLSDGDPAIRALTMSAFQSLAGFRGRKLAAVVDDIRAQLHDSAEPADEEDRAHGDLETALGITMDRLVDDAEQLERELYALEARRRELVRYMETEAVRVGEEIHHEVLNTLTAHLATAIDEADYQEARRGLDNLVAELRRIMNNLYPRDLETQGFLQTIDNRLADARRLLARRGSACAVRLDVDPDVTDAAIAACVGGAAPIVLLYRIVLEAINNARKHSRGTLIAVSVTRSAAGGIEVEIADNGAGGGGPFAEHSGTALMRRRAEEIGAHLEYRPAHGQGTAVVLRLGRPGWNGRHQEPTPRRPSPPAPSESGG